MNLSKLSIMLLTSSVFCAGAYAQTPATEVQRNVNQQERIEAGLKSGALNTREAAKLEREQSQVNRMQSRALRDGSLSAQESARINSAQNRVSRDIAREKHDAQTGNPNSASSQRMQADVQRDINQQKRIEQGVQSGQLSNREVARLERGQAQVSGAQARAGADGRVGAAEQARIQNKEDRQSRRIYQNKHNATPRG
jgi:hypothetical protein